MAGSNATPRGAARIVLQGQQPRVQAIGAAQVPTIQYSSGNARALADFSRNLFSLSNQFEDQLDEQAAAESTTEGALDGASGDIQLQSYGTIRGRAYNKAAIETYAATIDTQAMMRLAEIQQQYWNDPDGMAKAIGDYTDGFAETLAKVSPEQAIAFKQRNMIRGLPAVEAARDTNFKLTRAQADAALIENEAALRLAIKEQAGALYSENPERSRAAVNSIQMLQRDYMKVYSAIDPTTGRPLYSPVEIAKAQQEFKDTVGVQSALGWFDEQPNKADAYLKLTGGDFKVKLDANNDHVKIIMNNKGATRNDPIKPALQEQLKAAAAGLGDGISIQVHSGGQETAVEVASGYGKRTGSTRHDHGGAGDLRLVRNGKVLNIDDDRELYRQFTKNLAAAGVTGIGIDEANGYVHAGGGTKAAWGYRGKSASAAYLPSDFKAAIEEGYAGEPLASGPSSAEVSLSDTLSPGAFDQLDAEMRSRISFSNQQTDRLRAEEAKAVERKQDAMSFEYLNRIYSAGQKDPNTGEVITPPTVTDIATATRMGFLKPNDATAIQKALTTERPDVSDEPTLRDITTRIYAGEDMYQVIVNSGDKISAKDLADLLAKNQSVVRNQLGEFNADQKYYFNTLSDRLGQKNQFMPFDPSREARSAQALDEYRRRVLDPNRTETASQISDDIASRFTTADADIASGDLNGLVIPRFAVKKPNARRIDVDQTGKALNAALAAKKIDTDEWQQQMILLKTWRDLQDAEEKALDAKKGSK